MMSPQNIPSGNTPKILVRVNGDLYLTGWDKPEVFAAVVEEDALEIRQDGDLIRIVSLEDCHLSVPAGALVSIEKVGGDGSFSGLSGALAIGQVGGDLMLHQLGSTIVQMAGGDCQALEVTSLKISKVGGDFQGEQIGMLECGSVGGDFNLNGTTGILTVKAGGDIQMALEAIPTQPVALRAGGDIDIHVPAGANADLELNAGSHDIRLKVGGGYLRVDMRVYSGKLGSGGTKIQAFAGGDILVTDEKWDEDSLEDDFSEMQEDMQREFEQLGERARTRAEAWSRRADSAARHAQERIDEAMRRMEARGIFTGHRHGIPPIPPMPPMPPVPPVWPVESDPVDLVADTPVPQSQVSDEERMLVLQMLQEKKITVEEAEKLLEALEG